MNLILTLREEIVCLVTLLLLLWYSSRHGFYDNARKYTVLNLLAIGHVVFDIITVITVNNQDKVSPLVNRICHEIFYMFAILFCFTLVQFMLNLTYGVEKGRKIARYLAVIPALYLITMSFLPIEYVQGNGTYYSFGPCVFAGYACAMILFFISMILTLLNFRKLSSHDRFALIPAQVIMMIALLVQIVIPELLFTGADVTLITAAVLIGIIDNLVFLCEVFPDNLFRFGVALLCEIWILQQGVIITSDRVCLVKIIGVLYLLRRKVFGETCRSSLQHVENAGNIIIRQLKTRIQFVK